MLEPPAIPEADIVPRAAAAYGLRVSSIAHMPVGNDAGAWAFRLATTEGPRFLKLLTRRVDPASLAVPRFLADHGITGPVAPIPTAAGDLVDVGEDFSLVLYPFVDGEMGGESGLPTSLQTELGRVLRATHDLAPSPELAAAMRREDFTVPLATPIRELAVRVVDEPADDEFHRALTAVWAPRRDEIAGIVARTEVLGRRAADRDPPLVICHADVHAWNVLVTPDGGIAIVDWDGTFLAPRECDLMFVGDRGGGMEHDTDAFADGYGAFDADADVAAFYRYRWVTEEFDDYARRVMSSAFGRETREDALESFTGLFDPGEVVEAAYRSDPDLEA